MQASPARQTTAVGEFRMNLFPANEGGIDRAVRIIGGLAILSTVFVGPQSLWGLIGIVPLATGLIGSCPAYTLLGISTCGVRKLG
jgi:hypothetical protein